MGKIQKLRADQLLVNQGLVESRHKAKALILAGEVFLPNRRVEKAGEFLPEDSELRVRERPPYVSRGGLKMAAALDHFQVDPTDLLILDVGSSTGGFTDCLLQRGATGSIAIDVGTNQLAMKLRQDERVEVREGVNARHMKPEDLERKPDLLVMDLSFIGVAKVLPAVVAAADRPTCLVLVKPQFELGPEANKDGIVTDPEKRLQAARDVSEVFADMNYQVSEPFLCPVHGARGNVELFLLAHPQEQS